MNVDFPYHVDGRRRTATADDDAHVRGLIEQVLFTSPGERVMRPEFGSGLLELVFEPGGPELEATTQFLVHGALQQWLGDRVAVQSLEVRMDDGTLRVDISYVIVRTNSPGRATFSRRVA